MRWQKGFFVGILVLVLTMLWGVAGADSWTDEENYDISWYNSSDTEFLINSASQLAGLAKIVNGGNDNFQGKTISLASDIDLSQFSWTPIGNYDNSFQGVFDGCGHEVKNISISSYAKDSRGQIYSGFFTWLSGATIQNLTLQGNIICGDTVHFAGGFCAEAENVVFENCTSNMTFGDSTIYYAAGFAAVSGDISFINCTNNSNINLQTSSGVGGYIGFAVEGKVVISECTNTGNISSSYHTAGGFIAKSTADSIDLSSSMNSGNVTLIYTYGSQSGGFIGHNKSGEVEIEFCVNTGKITGADAGGIIARNTEESDSFASITIENCKNQGDIAVNEALDMFSPNIGGGIIGWCLNAQVNHCINYGNVTAS